MRKGTFALAVLLLSLTVMLPLSHAGSLGNFLVSGFTVAASNNGNNGGESTSQQHKMFFSQGRYWIFYEGNVGGSLYLNYTTSVSSTGPWTVHTTGKNPAAMAESTEYAVDFNATKVFAVIAPRTGTVYFAFATLNPDGTSTGWAWATVASVTQAQDPDVRYQASNGLVYVFFACANSCPTGATLATADYIVSTTTALSAWSSVNVLKANTVCAGDYVMSSVDTMDGHIYAIYYQFLSSASCTNHVGTPGIFGRVLTTTTMGGEETVPTNTGFGSSGLYIHLFSPSAGAVTGKFGVGPNSFPLNVTVGGIPLFSQRIAGAWSTPVPPPNFKTMYFSYADPGEDTGCTGYIAASQNYISIDHQYSSGQGKFLGMGMVLYDQSFNILSYGHVVFLGVDQAVGGAPDTGFCSQYYPSVSSPIVMAFSNGTAPNLAVTVFSGQLTTPGTESQKVLFRDDFLYTNNLLETSWTIATYNSPGVNPGPFTSSGYLLMPAKSTSGIETVHVTAPMYNPAGYSDGTTVKRKMTVAEIPFASKESPATASLKVGLTPLVTTGAYPGNTPYGTPNYNSGDACTQSANAVDNIGLEFVTVDNTGSVNAVACYDNGAGVGALHSLPLGNPVNPALYTVITVETYGVFCSTCPDNAFGGTAWAWYRIYQEDSTSKIIASTDTSLNFTTNVSPLYQTSYAFLSQLNSNSAATKQLSKVDFVQVQNYGSPVCLIAPSGALCVRLPVNPGHLTSDVIGSFAYLATLIGGGDEQAGAMILFLVFSLGMAGVPFILSKSVTWASAGELSVMGFFVYAGFFPTWTLAIIIVLGVVIMVMMVNRMISGVQGLGGGSGE